MVQSNKCKMSHDLFGPFTMEIYYGPATHVHLVKQPCEKWTNQCTGKSSSALRLGDMSFWNCCHRVQCIQLIHGIARMHMYYIRVLWCNDDSALNNAVSPKCV